MLEILKNCGIDEEKINEIVKAMGEAKIYTTSLENADVRYTKLQEQKKQYEEAVKDLEKQLKNIQKNNSDVEELNKTIEQLQLSNKNLEKKHLEETNKLQFDFALESALTKAKSRNTRAVKALLDMNSINYQEGSLNGLEEQLEALKESDSYLFDIETQQGGSGFNPGGGAPGFKNPFSKEHFNLTEQAKLIKENPILAAQLKNSI